MKRTKRILATSFALAFCLLSYTMAAFAVTRDYNWEFGNTADTIMTEKGRKNDSEQNYYITISSGTLSSTNIFGTRIRRSSDAAMMSDYVLHTGLKQSKPYAYKITANTTTDYELRGKKDDSSTTAASLKAVGKVTY